MPKHSDVQKSETVISVQSDEHQELLERLDPGIKPAIRVILKAVIARKPCPSCTKKGKKDYAKNKLGDCAVCSGTEQVDDFERNKWGVEQLLGRKLPTPKAVEMRVEDKSDRKELARIFHETMGVEQLESALSEIDRRLGLSHRKMVVGATDIVEEVTSDADGNSPS